MRMATDYVLWHNPRCSKSRGALQLLCERGIEPGIRDYLAQPPSVDELRSLLDALGIPPRQLLRTGETAYAERELGASDADDATLLAAMAAHPQLIERPILVSAGRAVIARPPERVLELL
jgi:arsenate reductase